MTFDKSRVYTALNANELPIGSKCIFADTIEELKALVQECEGYSKTELREIREGNEVYRFVDKVGHTSALAYLLLSPAEPKYKPFKNIDEAMEAIKTHGGWIKYKVSGRSSLVFAYDEETITISDDELDTNTLFLTYVFADDGSPCGKLVEE